MRFMLRTLIVVGLLGLVAVALMPIDYWALRPLEDRFPAPSPPARVDGVVVLGGAVSAFVSAERNLPTLNRDADRLVAFAVLARRYPEAKLVFAGGSRPSERGQLTEAAASAALLEQLGVSVDRLLVDDQSQTTWENAVNALALARPKAGETWLLVTSASHMPRSIASFYGAGWPPMTPWPVAYRTTPEGWPGRIQPFGAKLSALGVAFHEWAGLALYRLRGLTDQLLPTAYPPNP